MNATPYYRELTRRNFHPPRAPLIKNFCPADEKGAVRCRGHVRDFGARASYTIAAAASAPLAAISPA